MQAGARASLRQTHVNNKTKCSPAGQPKLEHICFVYLKSDAL
jgi:hypothetical protein